MKLYTDGFKYYFRNGDGGISKSPCCFLSIKPKRLLAALNSCSLNAGDEPRFAVFFVTLLFKTSFWPTSIKHNRGPATCIQMHEINHGSKICSHVYFLIKTDLPLGSDGSWLAWLKVSPVKLYSGQFSPGFKKVWVIYIVFLSNGIFRFWSKG